MDFITSTVPFERYVYSPHKEPFDSWITSTINGSSFSNITTIVYSLTATDVFADIPSIGLATYLRATYGFLPFSVYLNRDFETTTER